MAQASPVLKDMLEIAHGSTSNEGSLDKHPICLGEPFTVDKMNNLLGWFLRDEQLTIEELTDILEVGTFLEMECTRVTAINGLSRNQDFPPPLKLSLEISFLVPQWIEPAFLALLRADLSTITADYYIIMGPQVTHILTTTQAAVYRHCLLIALNPYRLVHQIGCNSPGPDYSVCQNKWLSGWKQNFAPLYLHPDIPLTPEESLHKLAFGSMPGVTPDCQNAAIQQITEMKVFKKEHEIIRKAVGMIKTLEGTKWYQKL
ncbi:hypothetical protein M422DRAFT_243580 [Sphaerobolus stellatus SS14]|nr:hypothetical protein M422DRAFT_243580 [Sphaerobolus stellatus SS14]